MPVRDITIDQLAGATEAGRLTLIDVRNHDEYATGHVPGATNLPLAELPDRLEELRGAGPLAVICQSGRRSATAVDQLDTAGLDAVSVAGGTNAWIDSGRPTHSG